MPLFSLKTIDFVAFNDDSFNFYADAYSVTPVKLDILYFKNGGIAPLCNC
jgi:hypothetical protein